MEGKVLARTSVYYGDMPRKTLSSLWTFHGIDININFRRTARTRARCGGCWSNILATMKISIDPILATEALRKIVPQYDEIIADLESKAEILPNLYKFAEKSGLSGYPLLYLDKQNLIKLVLLTLMPAAQINDLNEAVKMLDPDEAIVFANQFVKNLNQSPEKLDAILDPHFSSDLDEVDPSKMTDQSKIVMTTFFVWFYDSLSFLVHGRRIIDLVQSAINGDDEAFCLAIQIDRLVLSIPYFRERVLKALQLQTDEDARFLYNLGYRMKNPVLRGKIKQRKVWIALWLLDTMNLLDGSLTRTELLAMLDDAGIEGVGSEDNLSRMLRKFRAYQNKV